MVLTHAKGAPLVEDCAGDAGEFVGQCNGSKVRDLGAWLGLASKQISMEDRTILATYQSAAIFVLWPKLDQGRVPINRDFRQSLAGVALPRKASA